MSYFLFYRKESKGPRPAHDQPSVQPTGESRAGTEGYDQTGRPAYDGQKKGSASDRRSGRDRAHEQGRPTGRTQRLKTSPSSRSAQPDGWSKISAGGPSRPSVARAGTRTRTGRPAALARRLKTSARTKGSRPPPGRPRYWDRSTRVRSLATLRLIKRTRQGPQHTTGSQTSSLR